MKFVRAPDRLLALPSSASARASSTSLERGGSARSRCSIAGSQLTKGEASWVRRSASMATVEKSLSTSTVSNASAPSRVWAALTVANT